MEFVLGSYNRVDNWWWATTQKTNFSELRLVERTELNWPPTETNNGDLLQIDIGLGLSFIAEKRNCFDFKNFLASVAGINKLLIAITMAIFGGYIGYITKLKWI